MLISKVFGKNWRTTAAGMLGAAGQIALSLYQTGTVDSKTIGIAAGLAAVGYLAKDSGQTGSAK